ncbi:MAG: hypothetical protein KDK36_05535 [Leptospiraceae bacterium]|nr:hypothetical protein [Leptospiraceae bacterium]
MKSFFRFLILLFALSTPILSDGSYNFYLYAGGGAGEIEFDKDIANNPLNPLAYASSVNPSVAAGIDFLANNIPNFKIPTRRAQVGMEFRLFPYFGIGIGFSRVNYNISELRDDVIELGISLLKNTEYESTIQQTLSNYNIDYQTFLIALKSYTDSLIPRSINANATDVTLNLHILGDGVFDPYIGIGGSYGKCTSDVVSCLGTTAIGKIGFQINLSSIFIFLQGEGYYLVVREKAVKGGIGLRF